MVVSDGFDARVEDLARRLETLRTQDARRLRAVRDYVESEECRSVFFPTKGLDTTPAEVGLPFEEVRFQAPGGVRLHGWFIPHQSPRGTLLYLHGNAGNIGGRLDKTSVFRSLGLSVFLFDYRGYGNSGGSPTEAGILKDTEAAYRVLMERGVDPDKVVIYGESLGGAPAVYLAEKVKKGFLVTEGAFSSVCDMARVTFPLLPSWLLASRFDSAASIRRVRIPKLIIHSRGDEVVPVAMGRKLAQNAPEPKRYIELEGGHNSYYAAAPALFRDSIDAFLNDHGLAA